MSSYDQWLKDEEEWIGAYCKKTLRMSLFQVIPAMLLILPLLFAGLSLAGGSSREDMYYCALGGLLAGLIVGGFYYLILRIGLRPKAYVRKIRKSVEALSLSKVECEALGEEMRKAQADAASCLSYKVTGPNAKGTPARFTLTPHYAFLVGSYPYSILVRLSDIEEIRAGQEQKTAVTRRAKSKTLHVFTLYTIGFYAKDRGKETLPQEAMGFFDESIRSRILRMMKEAGAPVKP